MKPVTMAVLATLVLGACSSNVPASNPRGVGFGDGLAEDRAARDAELARPPGVSVPGRTIGSETLAVLDATATDIGTPASPTGEPLSAIRAEAAAPIAAAPAIAPAGTPSAVTATSATPGLSDEQSFNAVAARESIESDRERLERNRAQYEVIAPSAIPERTNDGRPNVVAFALNTSNPVGQRIYDRSGFNRDARFARACAGFPSQDRAQEAFLAAGGPERDRRGMDPDGDGFACYWDPTPYRAARN